MFVVPLMGRPAEMTASVTCVWPLAAELGEGPVWSPRDHALWFVDIKCRRLHRFDPATGSQASYDAPDQIGFALPCADGRLIAGLKTGLHIFEPSTSQFALEKIVEPHQPGNRLNDGYVDAAGRLWFGSMDDGEQAATGALYRFDRAGLTQHDQAIAITNGPCMSPDGATFYHTDTRNRVIHAFDVRDDGGLRNKRVLIEIEPGAGFPDGSAVDQDGCVWVALYHGWGVRRYDPSGRLITSVPFPCANITKIAFGGAELKTAYATTAWKGLEDSARAAQPLAGGLFAFDVATPGLASHAFTG